MPSDKASLGPREGCFAFTEEVLKELVEGIHAIEAGRYEEAVFTPPRRFEKLGCGPDGVPLVANSAQAYHR